MASKFALVTGASTGIGREIAVAFGRLGWTVGLVARREDRLLETKKLVESTGGTGVVLACDLVDASSVKRLAPQIERMDVLVNVAGIWHGENEVYADKKLEVFPEKVILDTFSVGIIAPMLLTRSFLPRMVSGGKIINISGTFESGGKGWLPYYVSKRAIEDFTVGLAQESRERGISVSCVSPSDVATEEYKKYFPQYIKDALDPKEVASFVAELCLDKVSDANGKVFVLKKGQEPVERFHA